MTMPTIDIPVALPDLWQQDAVRHILGGCDVVVDAPTGAGKTFIFELLVESRRLSGQLVFTVPTRALANDKLLEWRSKGWSVGIATGDISDNLDAPVLVATLESQKARISRGHASRLLVIDEYQMISDLSRGVNYEMVIAMAPANTQLLLLSGSVKNPEEIVAWLQQIGRSARLVRHTERPVPQEQYYLDTLPDRVPKSVFGYWPRYLYRALLAGLDPVLVFAPQRKDAERIARQVAACLPEDDPLELSPEQRLLAGDALAKLLKNRVAYHHSGLSYKQRAGVIEPLAKAGQLRVVVATTGLGAGINFSMRSVIIAERDYRQQDQVSQVRPDELLQMFGRAGRRGLDERGYILVLPEKPRLEDAAPIRVKRAPQVDWPSFLGVMHQARLNGLDPKEAAVRLAHALFTPHPPQLGLDLLSERPHLAPTQAGQKCPHPESDDRNSVVELLNSQGAWERRKGPHQVPLSHTLSRHRDSWKPAHTVAQSLAAFPFGTTCKLEDGALRYYGKEWIVAHFPTDPNQQKLVLNKKYRKALIDTLKSQNTKAQVPSRNIDIAALEQHLRHHLPQLTGGGVFHSLADRRGAIIARIDLRSARVTARKDSTGAYLLDPPLRQVTSNYQGFSIGTSSETRIATTQKHLLPAVIWQQLGLVDADARPTRRGVLFSFFNHGEGLAVAAALEDPEYPLEQLIWDLANLRTGHRFDAIGNLGSRLTFVCRETYGSVSFDGYLRDGLPEEYGEGGAELVFNTTREARWKHQIIGEEINAGDVERVLLEWKSILRQIAHAPSFPWERWSQLQYLVREREQLFARVDHPLDIPPLSARQRLRKPLPFRPKR
jgi:superfamily II DNA/RNA helicase